MSMAIFQNPKMDQGRRKTEYRKRRAKEKSRMAEILKKIGPLSHRDVSNFFRGLSAEERRLAGVMYIYKCTDADMTASEIFDFLKEE